VPLVLRIALLLAFAVAAAASHAQPSSKAPGQGVDVGPPSALRNLVPADRLERAAVQQYDALLREAAAKGALAPPDHPQLVRLRAIGKRVIANAARFNPDAARWRWDINLIGSKQINAFCMPGGKIAFFTGILDRLQLTDDEVAVIMGHEVAHALREHARERIAKSELTRLGVSIVGALVSEGRYADAFNLGGALATLKFSRDDETEADAVGLELAARAGYDPRAGVTLWRKMSAASRGAPPAWFSTHPSSKSRIQDIERLLPKVVPLYEQARKGA
jgi:predicted Zn-dependent protease